MAGIKKRISSRELFKKLNILPLASEFLLSLLSFVVDNMKKFQTNSDIHSTVLLLAWLHATLSSQLPAGAA
jgi:hypothetical protein